MKGRPVVAGLAAIVLVVGLAPSIKVAHALGDFSVPLPQPQVLRAASLSVTAKQATVQVFPSGPPTTIWAYDGIYPGPTIRRPSGTQTQVTFVNELPNAAGEITIHHHGNHSASSEDGQPNSFLIPPGGRRTYTYSGFEGGEPERGAFQWYHDHRMGVTCRNVERGLAGMYILDDGVDTALGLPTDNAFDVPLMISNPSFDANNQIVNQCPPNRPIPPLDQPTMGPILVNGVLRPYFEVADRKYRLRFLNASTGSFFNLQLTNGLEMIQVANESGLLPDSTPICGMELSLSCPRSALLLGPAERAEVVVDFAGLFGSSIILRSVARSLPSSANGTASVAANTMRFDIKKHATEDSPPVPAHLRDLPAWATPVPPTPSRSWAFGIGVDPKVGRPVWTINGKPFDDDAPPDAQPKLGSQETWTIVNHSVPYFGLSSPTHLVHIHDVDWLVVSRNGLPPPPWEAGLKETFLLNAAESIVVTSVFTDYSGPFMLHCHILQHEDNAMMAAFEVIE